MPTANSIDKAGEKSRLFSILWIFRLKSILTCCPYFPQFHWTIPPLLSVSSLSHPLTKYFSDANLVNFVLLMEDNPSGTVGSVHQDTDLIVMWPATATPAQLSALPTNKMLPDQFQAYFSLLSRYFFTRNWNLQQLRIVGSLFKSPANS